METPSPTSKPRPSTPTAPGEAPGVQGPHKWCPGEGHRASSPTSTLSRPGEGSRCQQASLGPPKHSKQVITKMGDDPISHCNYPGSPCQIQVKQQVSPIACVQRRKKQQLPGLWECSALAQTWQGSRSRRGTRQGRKCTRCSAPYLETRWQLIITWNPHFECIIHHDTWNCFHKNCTNSMLPYSNLLLFSRLPSV